MTQTPRRENTNVLSALAVAVFALCISWMMWTHVVTRMQVASIRRSIAMAHVRPMAAASPSHAAGMPLHAPIAAQLLRTLPDGEGTVQLHPAAGDEVAMPMPGDTVVREGGELAAWHLRKAYTISIPAQQISAPVLMPGALFWNARDWKRLEEQMQVGLQYGVVAYPHSVAPGDAGSIFLSGHSSPPSASAAESAYGAIFAAVPALRPGDRIVLTANGVAHTYTVISDEVVLPTMTRILSQQSAQPILKIITCYPVGTTRERWVVTAVLDAEPQ